MRRKEIKRLPSYLYEKYENVEIVVGYKCSDSDCNWSLGPVAWWQALKKFGQHNKLEHGGTISLHLEKDIKTETVRKF